ncbi:transferase [Pseudarthrobacter sp. S6]|uniref:PglD-related sugar-binding protein n=1 Tax=Pseudarthrobacter sp. S6 TaxID=3418420 RepID=UPI003CF26B52
MTSWLIIGGSGHAKSVAAIIRNRGDRVVGISDPNLAEAMQSGAGFDRLVEPFKSDSGDSPRIFRRDKDALEWAAATATSIAVAIGDNAIRKRVSELIATTEPWARLTAPLIAKSATVDSTAKIGSLTQVFEHAHIGPSADIGSGVIVNTSAVVEHDAVVGSGSHLAPGSVILGAVSVGLGVFIGSGARVLPGLRIGQFSIIGAGAVVTGDALAGETYAGIPARILQSKEGSTL